MAHTYDLLLQASDANTPLDSVALGSALDAAGARLRGDGVRLLRVPPTSRADLELHWLREGDALKALDCRIPLSDQPDVADAALRWALEFSLAHGLCVMDPQLNTRLTSASGAMLDEFMRQARYAGEYVGVSDAVGASSLAHSPDEQSSSTRVLLAVVVFFVVLYVTFTFVSSRPAEPPPRAPPLKVPLKATPGSPRPPSK